MAEIEIVTTSQEACASPVSIPYYWLTSLGLSFHISSGQMSFGNP
jgi:hypothetical protein